MPVKWDDPSPEAQERILREHPDVAPSAEPSRTAQALPRAPRRRPPLGDYYGPDMAVWCKEHAEYLAQFSKPQRRQMTLLTKVILLIGLAYALGAIFYAFYGG